jgi:membrane associated rhomboid family serine protease
MRMRYLFLIGALLLARTPDARAQRLRIAMNGSPARTAGTLHSISDSALVLQSSSGLLSFPAHQIAMIEQSAGRKPNVVIGLAGMAVGVAVGGVAGCAVNADSYGVFCGGQDDTKVVLGAAAGGITGALLGALLFKRERWRRVDFLTLQRNR